MMNGAPAHAWIEPRLRELLDAAEKAGIAREVAVAVIIDLMEAQASDDAGLDDAGSEPDSVGRTGSPGR